MQPGKAIVLQPRWPFCWRDWLIEPQRSCGAIAFVVTLLFSPETRGKELVPRLTLVERPA